MSNNWIDQLTYGWIALAFVIHLLLYFVAAPFGRHTSDKWGKTVNNKFGWFIVELPSLLIMCYFWAFGTYARSSFVWILFAFWVLHYGNRTFIYPLRIKETPKRMPLLIVANAIFFNIINAGLNGYMLSEVSAPERYGRDWLSSTHFIVGALLFIVGISINLIADQILIGLRKKGETGYKIPHGFLFEYVSAPNLLGEIIEWTGFAVMAWNLPALSFAIWTFANLVPRALNHHQWYQAHFADYPKNRKAVFPYLF